MKLLNNVPLRLVCFYVPQKWRKWQKHYYVPIHIYTNIQHTVLLLFLPFLPFLRDSKNKSIVSCGCLVRSGFLLQCVLEFQGRHAGVILEQSLEVAERGETGVGGDGLDGVVRIILQHLTGMVNPQVIDVGG